MSQYEKHQTQPTAQGWSRFSLFKVKPGPQGQDMGATKSGEISTNKVDL
jgi:hypothetical protein